jgi:hypothetical protein
MRGKPFTVSTDRVNPAYIFNEDDCGKANFNPAATSGYIAARLHLPNYTLRLPRPLPCRLLHQRNYMSWV